MKQIHLSNTNQLKKSSGNKTLILGASLGFIILGSLTNPCSAATFEEKLKSVSASIETQPEAAIIALLQAGISEGKSTQAIAETQKWLLQNQPKDGMLLYYAGQAAEISGDLKNSVVLYQQYLLKADLKSATADEAVYAIYTILIEQLGDPSGAYAFGKNDGNRVMVCPRARQFDQWFLDEAVRRGDAIAVSNRLHACFKSGLVEDLLIARYSNYLNWLLDQVSIYADQPGINKITPEFLASYKELSKAITFKSDIALRLDWAVSVIAYNQAKLAGKPATAPVAEANALLTAFPQYAKWVQDGWAGGGNGQHYRGDITKYWPEEIEAKMAPIVAASEKLTPPQLAELFQSWREGYYMDRVVRPFEVKAVRQKYHFATYGDKLSTRDGVLIFGKPFNEVTPEEAQLKAAKLVNVNDPQASLIRAMAAGGAEKDLNKMMAALLGPEAWRLTSADLDGRLADQLWHLAGRPAAVNRDQKIQESKTLLARIKAEALPVTAAPQQRKAKFDQLWADYRSPQPKIPAVYEQLKAIVKICPESIPELLKDSSSEAQLLARSAISEGITSSEPIWIEIESTNIVSVTKYAPGILFLAQRHSRGVLEEMKKSKPNLCKPHPLEAYLRKSVTDDLNGNKLQAWQVMAWINMQYPEDNAEQVKLMQQLSSSPAWQALPFEVQSAARQWFGKVAMTPAQAAWLDTSNRDIVFKDLIGLNKESDVAASETALKLAIEGAKKSPVKINIKGLEKLAEVSDEVFNDPKIINLILEITTGLRFSCDVESEPMAARLLLYMGKNPDPIVLQKLSAFLWSYGKVEHYAKSLQTTLELTQSLLLEHPSTASAMAKKGLVMIANNPQGHQLNWFNTGQPALKAVVGKSAMTLGLVSIPVPRDHPAYPIYESQGSWLTGNEDSAWDLCDQHWEQLILIHRELTIPYLSWALERVLYSRDEARQEELIKALLAWSAEPTTPLTLEQKIQFELSYGDIAMQRGQLREAHQIYTKTRENKAYEGVLAIHQATLRKADAERVAKDFDGALTTLGELELERVPEMWAPARYARAVVNYDREEYDDANDDIQSILAREANHGEAKILLGKVQLKRKKLMEATEIEVTPNSSQTTLVPGEKLKVTLVDPTLAVSGAGTEIEVVVWAKSGDKETFFLRQFGDQKTKFRGEVATALGAPNLGDRILQVIGDDEVFYAYSERFRAKMNNLAEKRGGPISIASNATLMSSSRKLLTEEEQRIADMEQQMDSLKSRSENVTELELTAMAKAERAAEVGRKLAIGESLDSRDSEFEKKKEASVETRVKPGNPIHVRVIDPDRSRTPEIDELVVSVESSSGDSISRITLKETSTHSGWFEGSIPTTGAQAMAYAQNSEPGRNPNMVLSPDNNYPAWRSVAVQGVIPEFNVDLNDNVKLGELAITAKEQGSKLKKFILLSGMNPEEMTPIAIYPTDQLTLKNPWQPSVTIMNDTDALHTGNGRQEFNLPEMQDHLNRGWMSQQFAQGVSANVAGPSEALPEALYKKVEWKRNGHHPVSSVIYRFRGYFYESAEVTRQFKLELGGFQIPADTHPSINHQPKFMVVVNGRPISQNKGNLLEGSVDLKPGVHSFEIWAIGWVANLGFGRDVKLLTNHEAGKPLAPCPDSFFDSTKFPKGILTKRNPSATISANDDGSEFKVKFAPDSSARLLKLVFIENEGPIPALNKLALSTPDGKKVLPVAEDYATLNKNDTLEILTGDKISVRYVDDRFVTKAFEKLERFLQVEFSTAEIDFADIKPRFDGRSNKDMPYFEKLLRFPYGQPLSLVINDPDMDVSVEPDTLKVTVQSDAGGSREFIAKETGPSTGVFEAILKPVPSSSSAENEMQVAEGGVLTAIYRDQENITPGVPTDRFATIIQAAFTQPILSLSQPTVNSIDISKEADKLTGYQTLVEGFIPMDEWQMRVEDDSSRKAREEGRGLIRPSWLLSHKLFPTAKPPEGGFQAVHGRRMFIELFAPQLALGTSSTVAIYAQTDAGRKLSKVPLDGKGFDLSVPGTIELTAALGTIDIRYEQWQSTPKIASYQEGPYDFWANNSSLERFTVHVPLIAGHVSEYGLLSTQERYDLMQKVRSGQLDSDEYNKLQIAGLVVSPGENIHIGVKYKDKSGADQWLTTTSKVITHPVFDVMEEGYKEPKTTAYVGETIHLRVVDLGGDVSDKNDIVSVLMQAKSGAKHRVDLVESSAHSGVFKGSYQLSYIKASDQNKPTDPENEEGEINVRREGFPVNYDDAVAMRYTASNGIKTPTQIITISKGSDGTIKPFSKQYDDEEIAMRTQFSLAESFLELAKSHRLLGKNEMAALEYQNAKQLLAAAMDQFKDPDTRSHAEYLLGTLSLEEADDTPEGDIKEDRYRAALSRFMNVVGTYPETLHASKAQYRIATVYEKLKQPDIAAQEYVKLAYKHPDSEFLATAMAKLGSYFLRNAATYEQEAKDLLADTENKDAQFEGLARQALAEREYIKTAQIFGRLQQRFPSDPLAGKAGLRAGQSYMRAKKLDDALAAFLSVSDNEGYDGKTLRSEGMYWAGMCYQALKQEMAAYSIYKRLTYDFPESKWAAYARGQLSQGSLQLLENELEIERLEEGR